MMYLGVLAIGVAGALASRLRPRGMAFALFAMAVGQMLVPLAVPAIPNLRGALYEPPGVIGVFGLNAAFALLWLGAAGLLWKAARSPKTCDARGWI